ncbi:50S ribosomal protein L7/L12 [Mycoplasmopsis ciconiae]|uniref:Large ribosomal subunit protein bL12 n=1 Tax=Mycoplasmopsis ciconiae TaxID=561067 RepID=A0ABU7MKF6_9BACT|nr:50S ribosomal protein L7/L12 [Mycoplasmopsis ciconiae]
MAKLTKESFIESLKEMSIKEVMELVDAMKEEFGIDPMAAVAVAAPAGEAAEEKSEVTVTLQSASNKVAVIKVVKEILGVGLMDAKKVVDSLPAKIKENIKPEEAEAIKAQLVEAGAEVSID